MTDLAKLVVRLEAETAKYSAELDKAKRQLSGFEKSSNVSIAKIGAAAGAAAAAAAVGFVVMTKSAIDTAASLNDLSQATGVSVESLSQLQYVAKLSGTDFDTLTASMQKLAKTAVDAARGSDGAVNAFKAIGVSATNADGSIKSTDQLLADIADSFANFEDGAGKAAVAQEIFGKSGAQLIPLLNKGRDGIDALRQEADKLGLTISGNTADAASEFNDNLERLKSATTGVATQVASDVVPALADLTDQIVAFVTQGDGASAIADAITTAFKLIVDVGSRVAQVFSNVGNSLGAIAAAAVAAAHGNFSQAFDIIKQGDADTAAADKRYTDFRTKIWDDAGKQIVNSAQKTDDQLKKTLSFGAQGSALQEVKVTASKIEDSPMQKFYAELDELTQTSTDKAIASYHEQLAALDFLYEQGLLDAKKYNERLAEIQTDTLGLDEVEITVKRVKENYEKASTELNEFQKQAARNTQDIIADSLTNGFKDGARGILQAFGDMIVQLTAQAVAADLAKKLFGSSSTGNSADGAGWVGALLSVFAGKASGGPVTAGTPYIVGEQGPEMFVPDTSGSIVPNHAMGGSVQMNNTFVIQTPNGRIPLETQQQIATRTAQALAQAQRRNG